MYDLFDNGYHTVLVFPSSSGSAKPFVDYFQTCKQGLFKVIVVLPAAEETDVAAGGVVIVDRKGHARANYRIDSEDTVAVLVRPDTFIGARVQDVGGVKEYLSLFTGSA
ncbi:hypothetical protein CYLTODRAFT_457228 [Cylindrobasidium torrendii FP15055 ss-10]|uniref:Uncharacterized protein n=1 Tax=Cylindrobasidium torrendii FP15055 ss-10 TaxID=1314674 RepID=A0A0D7B4J4_9AGAR|nr:hypothetical protein CYLTODRAFT_457228 [Cylindrobasidium torrendii FP15055 ss-10]